MREYEKFMLPIHFEKKKVRDVMKDLENERERRIILETLNRLGVDAILSEAEIGPTVTRYDIGILCDISAERVIRQSAEFAMQFGLSGVRMYENEENGKISIELPNAKRTPVLFSDLLPQRLLPDMKHGLFFPIGRGFRDEVVLENLAELRNVLIAGAAGSGKTIFLNSMIASLITKYPLGEVCFVMLGSKREGIDELQIYNGLRYLLTKKVIYDQDCFDALDWLVEEMEQRYRLFETKNHFGLNIRNVNEFNKNLVVGEAYMTKIVVVIDDLCGLLRADRETCKDRLLRICQKARAAGIYVVASALLTDERDISDVVSLFPTRVAFRVGERALSKCILGESGAEFLLGEGDLLFKTEISPSRRIQGAYISPNEIKDIIAAIQNR